MRNKILLMALILLTITAVNVPMFERFTITDDKSGHIVFLDKVERYKEFYIRFTHSVNKTPVNEYYSVSEDAFILERASFYSYGAGMPEDGEYGSGKPSIYNGMVHMDDINKVFKKFTYFAGTYANHSLNTDDTQILFLQFLKPQTPATFEVKKVSIITLLRSYWFKI